VKSSIEGAGWQPSRRDVLRSGGSLALLMGLGGPILAACGSSGEKSGSSKGGGGTISVGEIIPSSGPLATSYKSLYAAARIAVEEINKAGGIAGQKLSLLVADDQGAVEKEPAATRQLLSKGSKVILGPTGPSQAFSSLAISTQAKVIQFAFVSDDAGGDSSKYPYHYQCTYNSTAEVEKRIEFLVEKKGVRKIGVLIDDTGSGHSDSDAENKILAEAGLQPTGTEAFPTTVTDMTPFLRKLQKSGAEALSVHISAAGPVAVLFAGLHQIGWKPIMVGANGMNYAAPGGGVVDPSLVYDDVYADTYRALMYTDTEPLSQKIRTFGDQMSAHGVTDAAMGVAATSPYYDALKILKQIGDKVGSLDDAKKLKQELDSLTDFDGLFGKISFTPTKHTAYGKDALGICQVNASANDQQAKESHLLGKRLVDGG
jgi:branched-chain amino acid transport system substrate-binding protein